MSDKQHADIGFCYKNGFFRRFSAVAPLQLYQLSEREVCRPQSLDTPLNPNSVQILVCIAGEGILSVSSISVPLTKDTVVFLCNNEQIPTVIPNDKHAMLRYAVIELAFYESMEPSVQSAIYTHFSSFSETIWFSQNNITHVVSQLIAELCLSAPMTTRIRGLLDQMLVYIYRAAVPKEDSSLTNEPSINAVGHTVYAIIRYIDENLYSIHSLMDMAEKLGYSYNYLSHLFRRKTGMTIQNYFAQKKIDASRELLLDDRYSITEISTMLNYDCIQSFSKAFKKAIGMSPTEFRTVFGQTQ